MLRFTITPETRTIINLLMKHPVFISIISQYTIDEKYVYIPKERISDKVIIDGFIEQGVVIRCDENTLEPLKDWAAGLCLSHGSSR